MGWWTTDENGNSFATAESGVEMLWGDEPADAIDNAVRAVVENFNGSFDRNPTKSELRAGLEFALSVYAEEGVDEHWDW